MIIMPDDHQPTPIERLLDWEVAYRLIQYSKEKLRNEPIQSNQPTEETA